MCTCRERIDDRIKVGQRKRLLDMVEQSIWSRKQSIVYNKHSNPLIAASKFFLNHHDQKKNVGVPIVCEASVRKELSTMIFSI